MKKSRTLLIALSAVIALSSSACGGGNASGGKEPTVKVWTPYATQKIMRDRSYSVSSEPVLKYEMAKNETEGAQFIITPENDYKVEAFTVEVTDLACGDSVIAKKDISVYLEKYVRIVEQINHNEAYGAGYTPDPLLPFDKAIEYKENKVEGLNQGVYITVKTHKDTPAGTYTGSCKINVDGKKTYNVPVKVTVWDFAISDEVHTRSLFDIWSSYLMNCELENSPEMYDKYAAALNEYGLSATSLNVTDGTLEDMIAEFIEKARVATKNPKVTAYDIPTLYFEGISTSDCNNRVKLFKEVAKASTEDCCLFDKMILYFGTMIDEPQFDASRDALVNPVIESIELSKQTAVDELTAEGFFDTLEPEYAEHLKERMLKIPNILTGPYRDYYIDGGATYCPLFDQFATEEKRAVYADQKSKNGEVWWYGCTGPCYPFPTYHLDDHLLGARVLNWMMYDYDIDGNLYWCVNEIDTHTSSIYDEVNPKSMNGDGYLFYPGVNYGIDGPVGSMRLQTIRDGIEDYEYLYELGILAEDLSDYYDEEISARSMLRMLFDRMYSNVYYVPDDANFYSVRGEIADIMSRSKSSDKFVAKGIEYDGEYAVLRFNASKEYSVTVNGESLAGESRGQGKTYSYRIKTDKAENVFAIELKKGDETKAYTLDAGGKSVIAADFSKDSDIKAVTGNGDNITFAKVGKDSWEGGKDALKAEIVSTFDPENPLGAISYRPELVIKLSDVGFDLNKLSSVKINVYNGSGRAIKISFLMKTNTGLENEFLNQTLAEGWNTISIDGIAEQNWSQLTSVNRFILRFNNTENNENKVAMPKQTVYLSQIIAQYTK